MNDIIRQKESKTLWEVIMDNAESTSNDLSTKLRQRITEYLTSEGWRVGGAKYPKGAQWVIEANDGKGRPITIYQESTPLRIVERIMIITALVLGDEHQGKYADLSIEDRRDLIYDLRQHLILLGVGYGGLVDPLTKMLFEDIIYLDELSKGGFLKSVRKVRDASILANTIISRRFNEPPPPEPPRPALGFPVPEK
jgi:hypothetical protein